MALGDKLIAVKCTACGEPIINEFYSNASGKPQHIECPTETDLLAQRMEWLEEITVPPGHASGCAVYNPPAFPPGPCNCDLNPPSISQRIEALEAWIKDKFERIETEVQFINPGVTFERDPAPTLSPEDVSRLEEVVRRMVELQDQEFGRSNYVGDMDTCLNEALTILEIGP